MSKRLKIAVIGTGAAGFGALKALENAPIDLTVFDIGKPIPETPPLELVTDETIKEYYNRIYTNIRAVHPFKFPPPKTHFSETLPKSPIRDRKRTLHRSHSVGGLTNFWGGTMLPFTDLEFEAWPIEGNQMRPYYQKIADTVGISGHRDGLNTYFREDFSNRPPFKMVPMLSKLNGEVNRSEAQGSYLLRSGLNRCALETREDQSNGCVHCGECLSGCFRGSIFSSREYALKVLQKSRFVKDRVTSVDPVNRTVYANGNSETFDKVFLCAGCPGTTEIVMRSAGLRETAEMADNAVYVFPIIYTGSVNKATDAYLSLTNLIIGCLPRDPNHQFAQVQVYPNFDYLWRYNTPPALWPSIRPLLQISRGRIFWGRLYVHGDMSQAYRVHTNASGATFSLTREASGDHLSDLMTAIRMVVNKERFWIPIQKPLLQKANSHYAATLPYGGSHIPVSPGGEVFPGVYLCDSAPFPELPAVSLTFTIMANACRTVTEALND